MHIVRQTETVGRGYKKQTLALHSYDTIQSTPVHNNDEHIEVTDSPDYSYDNTCLHPGSICLDSNRTGRIRQVDQCWNFFPKFYQRR
ncbi:hypothetical protein ACHAXM_009318 [Skeletonema potamos]